MAVTLVARKPATKDFAFHGRGEFLIDSASDLSSGNAQIEEAFPGSIAYIPDTGVIYMKKNNGTWVVFGGEE